MLRRLMFLSIMGMVCAVSLAWAGDIEWQDISRGNTDIRSVLVSLKDTKGIYVGTRNAVLKSKDNGSSWRTVLSINGQNRIVNFLGFGVDNEKFIYAATGNGLFFSRDEGEHWDRIFKGRNYLESDCRVLAVSGFGLYLGTAKGLFISRDNGRSWHKAKDRLGDTQILAIACSVKDRNLAYVVCVDGVFKSKDAGESWERIFSIPASRENNEPEEPSGEDVDENNSSRLNYLAVDYNNTGCIYLATRNGIYRSCDSGLNWDYITDYGLLNKDVKFILLSQDSRLYAISKVGVFMYSSGSWIELSAALAISEPRFLAIDDRGNLYLASDKGVFKSSEINNKACLKENMINFFSNNEPTIKEVQNKAIYYAEVEPEKIQRWRKQAKMKAILPKLTISVDHDNDKTVSNNIWGIYSSYASNGNMSAPGRHYIGPDDETRYNNNNFSVSLSWELGDLIWNNDQTSIDTRSRLMVELRDDIMDEVTKTYFERIRVKIELNNLPIEDRRKRFEKELRVQELTASLDALTGGYFSEHIKSGPS